MMRNLSAKAEILIIVLLACVPMLIHLPYRVNIFLSWEGAYRMSQGQLPFRDFGIPLGGMYWVIPAVFFKLFGAKLITLVKAQVFINIVAGLAFRSVLKSLSVNTGVRLAAVLLFCISYSFFNFWPWYNHSVIFYELVALAFLFRYIRSGEGSVPASRPSVVQGAASASGLSGVQGQVGSVAPSGGRFAWAWLSASALFLVFSFLTKQDGGGMAFMIAFAVLLVYSALGRNWKPLLIFTGSYIAALLLIILPFLKVGFGYWFNHGQAPHTARVSAFDITEEFLGASQWIKFYLFLLVVLILVRYRGRTWTSLREDSKDVLLVVLTLGILGEASIFQVTSYTPPDNNIFFHSFAFAAVLTLLIPLLKVDLGAGRWVVILSAGVLLWWSGTWWKYTSRVAAKILPHREQATSATGENVVNRSTYMINRDTAGDIPMDQWVGCDLPGFEKITMPAPTVAGIRRLMDMKLIKEGRGGGLRVLNMSELTPLAAVVPFALERNGSLPLWYHLGVGMFNRQADTLETRIRDHYYDLVLFEYIPTLNNFYPFRVRDSLKQYYRQVDAFMAPRRGGETMGNIEVFVRPAEQ